MPLGLLPDVPEKPSKPTIKTTKDDKREWLRLKWTVNDDIQKAKAILKSWAKVKQTPRNLARAIRLYDGALKAIQTGDFECFWQIFGELFPEFMAGMRMAQAARPAFNHGGAWLPPVATAPARASVTSTPQPVPEMPKLDAAELIDYAADEFGISGLFDD